MASLNILDAPCMIQFSNINTDIWDNSYNSDGSQMTFFDVVDVGGEQVSNEEALDEEIADTPATGYIMDV
eukprot:9626456-Ditylum_brightwellii.AAC.1